MPLKIFYLDDEVALLNLFVEIYSSPEVSVQVFSKPQELIAAVKASPPDLVFLDSRLPYTTGAEVAAQLDPAIPKVLITGDISVENNSGFIAVLGKPVRIGAIQKLINEIRAARAA